MKLYVAPAACSMSCHIAFEEAGIPVEVVISKWGDQARWTEIRKLNPREEVPVLDFDDGRALTQNVAILEWVADQAPNSGLLPACGTYERAQVLQWLSWVAADLHKAFSPLFDDTIDTAARKRAEDKVIELLSYADKQLEGRDCLVGTAFTVADAYLYTVYNWHRWVRVPTEGFRNLPAYSERIGARPAVQVVLRREGLIRPS